MIDLQDKTALVTGSSRGIGRDTAERLARSGAVVAVHAGKDVAGVEDVVASIVKAGGRAFPVVSELGRPGDVDTLFSQLEAGLRAGTGEVGLDILVNNVGLLATMPVEEITPAIFDELIAVNARAPLFIVQRALPILRDGGRIINVSTGLTRFANPSEVAHAMSKAALEMISLHLARYLGPRRITVNTVAPGVVDTGDPFLQNQEVRDMLARLSPFGRVGEPADISEIVAFLASDGGRWITGAWIDATGGALLGQRL